MFALFFAPGLFFGQVDLPTLILVLVLPIVLGIGTYLFCLRQLRFEYRWAAFIPLAIGAGLGYGFFRDAHDIVYSDYNNLSSKQELLHNAAFFAPIVVMIALFAYDFFRQRLTGDAAKPKNIF